MHGMNHSMATTLIPLLGHLLFSMGVRYIPKLANHEAALQQLLARLDRADADGCLNSLTLNSDENVLLLLALGECARLEDEDFETIIGCSPLEVSDEIGTRTKE